MNMDSNGLLPIDTNKLDEYYVSARDYCLTNGLVMFPRNQTSMNCAVNLPVTLLPTKFNKDDFNYACNTQNLFNLLVHKIGNNKEFLHESLKKIINADEFTRRLWNIYEEITSEGITQPITFEIIRSDYMLDSNKLNESTRLSQIEINTVASSFGAATSKITNLHNYMLRYTNNQEIIEKQAPNDNLRVLAEGFIDAWNAYGNKKAIILFIVNEIENNIGDQRLLEFEILRYETRIKIIRKSLSQVYKEAQLNKEKFLLIDNSEVAIVYFRDGYDPEHYKTEKDWDARLMIERSKAIKCPSIQHHLAGAKKIQQELSKANILEKFLDKSEAKLLRATFVDQYSFDFIDDYDESRKILDMMLKNSGDFVLKPQREGGGNNVYGEDIKEFVKNLKDLSELNSFILMKLIRPVIKQNYLLRHSSREIIRESIISELGVYGVIIGDNTNIISNKTGGYLLRSKSNGTLEGGVAAGFSVLDSIYFE